MNMAAAEAVTIDSCKEFCRLTCNNGVLDDANDECSGGPPPSLPPLGWQLGMHTQWLRPFPFLLEYSGVHIYIKP